jgi:anti-sigma factor RsiW
MTPQLDTQHLSSDQMSDLLACALSPRGQDACADLHLDAAGLASAEAHLLTCAACAAEFASLRETFDLFREASVAYADQEFSRMRIQRPTFPVLPSPRTTPQGLVWLAASVILMAGVLPLEMRWQRGVTAPASLATGGSAHSAESDEALLEDINRDLSASVPAPMQALADPTGGDSDSVQAVDGDAQDATDRRE